MEVKEEAIQDSIMKTIMNHLEKEGMMSPPGVFDGRVVLSILALTSAQLIVAAEPDRKRRAALVKTQYKNTKMFVDQFTATINMMTN